MTDNIPGRLRDWAALDKVEAWPVLVCDLQRAADHIEQLNKEAEHWRDLAQEGWGYADEYFQHKWLPDDLLKAWFPDNRYAPKETDRD